MSRFMQQLMRWVIVAAVFLMLLGAWDPNFVLVTFRVGLAVFILAFLYGLLGGKDMGFPLAVGLGLMFEAILANQIQTGIKIASIIMALAAIVWLVRARDRTLQRQQQSRERQRIENFQRQGNWH